MSMSSRSLPCVPEPIHPFDARFEIVRSAIHAEVRRRRPPGRHAWRQHRLAILIGVVSLVACSASTARAQDTDPWFGRDKAFHFAATTCIAAGGYGASAAFTDDRAKRLLVGGSLAMAAGIGKEVWDLDGHGDASWRDLTWDVIGTVTGLAVATAIDWLIHR